MGKVLLMMIAICGMVMGSSMSYEEVNDTNGVIYVGGKVLCQDCTQGWNEWVHDAKPIKGAKVSITCMDDRKRVIYYGSDECDETGSYEMTINKYINNKKLDPKKCSARLVSSPNPVCNIPTDFSGGRLGVKLNNPNVVYRDMIKYVHEPFYYTTPMCDDPESNENEYSSGRGNKY